MDSSQPDHSLEQSDENLYIMQKTHLCHLLIQPGVAVVVVVVVAGAPFIPLQETLVHNAEDPSVPPVNPTRSSSSSGGGGCGSTIHSITRNIGT